MLILAAILAIAVVVVLVANAVLGTPSEAAVAQQDKYNLALKGFDVRGYDKPYVPGEPDTLPTSILGGGSEYFYNDSAPPDDAVKIGEITDSSGDKHTLYTSGGGGGSSGSYHVKKKKPKPTPEPECESDSDCDEDEKCTSGKCVKEDECEDDDDCDEGYVCTGGSCVEEDECESDSDCDGGYVCEDGSCVKGPECTHDDNCTTGYVCKDGDCVAKGCTTDSDCLAGFKCVSNKCADITPPVISSMYLQGNLETGHSSTRTNTEAVTVLLAASDAESEVHMCGFSNDNVTFTWSSYNDSLWITSTPWTIPTGNGTKTVHSLCNDTWGNEAYASNTIVLTLYSNVKSTSFSVGGSSTGSSSGCWLNMYHQLDLPGVCRMSTSEIYFDDMGWDMPYNIESTTYRYYYAEDGNVSIGGNVTYFTACESYSGKPADKRRWSIIECYATSTGAGIRGGGSGSCNDDETCDAGEDSWFCPGDCPYDANDFAGRGYVFGLQVCKDACPDENCFADSCNTCWTDGTQCAACNTYLSAYCENATGYPSWTCGSFGCESGEDVFNCPQDCCASDCTGPPGSNCKDECKGYNGCTTVSASCDSKSPGKSCSDSYTLLTCCGGATQDCSAIGGKCFEYGDTAQCVVCDNDGICETNEDVVGCPNDCCLSNCTGDVGGSGSDGICHKNCDGKSGCSFADSVCDGEDVDAYVCVDEDTRVQCCDGSTTDCGLYEYCWDGVCAAPM